jgi:hypothetical protein
VRWEQNPKLNVFFSFFYLWNVWFFCFMLNINKLRNKPTGFPWNSSFKYFIRNILMCNNYLEYKILASISLKFVEHNGKRIQISHKEKWVFCQDEDCYWTDSWRIFSTSSPLVVTILSRSGLIGLAFTRVPVLTSYSTSSNGGGKRRPRAKGRRYWFHSRASRIKHATQSQLEFRAMPR